MKYIFSNVKIDILWLNIENDSGQFTTQAKREVCSFDEIFNDYFADRWKNITDDTPYFVFIFSLLAKIFLIEDIPLKRSHRGLSRNIMPTNLPPISVRLNISLISVQVCVTQTC